MRQTLFYIPHEWLGVPVFGLGWALLFWGIFCGIYLWWLSRQERWSEESKGQVPVLVTIAVAIVFLLPRLEEGDPADPSAILGLPIRGYGVFLLIAVVLGVGLAVYRARLMGLDPEVIYSLAFVLFLSGIFGARALFVAQYWNQFASADLATTLVKIFNVAKGGLVVYGSVIAALPAMYLFTRIRGLPFLALADLIAPSLMLGLAIGRVGCLMNGCCFGGLCEYPWAVEFPREAPPYAHQLQTGELHGFRIGVADDGKSIVVRQVLPDTPAAREGLKPGDRILLIDGTPVDSLDAARQLGEKFKTNFVEKGEGGERVRALPFAQLLLARAVPRVVLNLADGRQLEWTLESSPGKTGLPTISRPVHPTQLYATINGLLLCLLLLAYYPYRSRDGEVIALLLTLYAVARILEEVIRDDEGNFLLGMTISQTISTGMLLAAPLLWAYVRSLPPGSALPPPMETELETPQPAVD